MTDTLTALPHTEARPAFLDGFARMHAAMRRDAERLPRAVAVAANPDATAALRQWYRRFRSTIEHHHQREDTIIWPELIRRDPSFAEAQAELVADHHVLDAALAAVDVALADGGDVPGAARQLAGILVDHLAREEAAAFPRLAACFTAEEWTRVERSLLKGTSIGHLAFEIPWVLDGLEEQEIAQLKGEAPLPLRIAYRLVFAPRYVRIAAPVLAVG